MKSSKLIAPTLAFALTASFMFVTVTAAAQENAPAPDAAFDVAPVDATELPPVPQSSIAPDAVLHSRHNHVSLNPDGGFSGQMICLDGSSSGGTNVMVIRNGVVAATAVTDASGSFTMSGVGEGVVTILGTGGSGLILISARLINGGNALADATPIPVKLKAETAQIGLNSAMVCGADVAIVRDLIMGGLPSGDDRFSDAANSDQYPFGGHEASTSVAHHTVQLQSDGSLQGEVNVLDPTTGRHREVSDLMLHFVSNGEHVGATPVQADGHFQMIGLTPGRYSIATTGRDGNLALGIDVLGSLAKADQDTEEFKLTSISQSLGLSVSPGQPRDFNSQTASNLIGSAGSGSVAGGELGMEGVPFGGPAGGPFAGGPGGGVGGGVGGGGAGGGGGGLGSLLGAAAAGAIGYAIGDRDSSPRR